MSVGESLSSLVGPVAAAAVALPKRPLDELSRSKVLSTDEMDAPLAYALAGGTVAFYTRRSPAKQTPNEDTVGLAPLGDRRGVLIVADGLGGHASGEQASQMAVKTLLKSLQGVDDDDLRPTILNGIEAANTAVCELSNGSATTFAIAEIQDGVVRTYHVGDSAILLTGGRGRVKFQTIAHSPIGYAVEAGLIDEQDAMHHEDRHMISNVIGASDMRIEIGPPVKLAPRDTLVLASDGLFDNLLPHEVIELIRRGPIARGVAKLADEALTRMTTQQGDQPCKPDDLTIVAFRLG